MTDTTLPRIAVIGAGLAGLTCAKQLQHYGQVTVFEKARGVGGRMTTRYTDTYEFDHGTQFFIAKTPAFQDFLHNLLEDKVIARWDAKFVEIDSGQVTVARQWQNEPAHFVAVPRMNALCKHLAQGLSITLQYQVDHLSLRVDGWYLSSQETEHGPFDWVIVTAPVAQTQTLLPDFVSFKAELAAIHMLPCFSLMLGYQGLVELPWDAAVIKGSKISWIANNSVKPGRNKPGCLMVHSTNAWAEQHLEDSMAWIQEELLAATLSIIGHKFSDPKHVTLHRWRYANAPKSSGPLFYLDSQHQIATCGDWCIKGRVEAAWLSSQALSNCLF